MGIPFADFFLDFHIRPNKLIYILPPYSSKKHFGWLP